MCLCLCVSVHIGQSMRKNRTPLSSSWCQFNTDKCKHRQKEYEELIVTGNETAGKR